MLTTPRPIAEELLAKHAEQGSALIKQASLIGDFSDFESWEATRKGWIKLTTDALRQTYDGPEEVEQFKAAAQTRGAAVGASRWQEEQAKDAESVLAAIDVLVSLHQRLESAVNERLESTQVSAAASMSAPSAAPRGAAQSVSVQEPIEAPAVAPEPTVVAAHAKDSGSGVAPLRLASAPEPEPEPAPERAEQRRVFVLHGGDHKRTQNVASLLETAGRHPVTSVHERSREMRTLIERFEDQAASADFAVVLLTADDVGAQRLDAGFEPCFSPRARQGVVFELGFLVGALTRRNVCVLYEHGVELPTNVEGLAYLPLDVSGAWQAKLLLALRRSGFDYDLDKVPPAR